MTFVDQGPGFPFPAHERGASQPLPLAAQLLHRQGRTMQRAGAEKANTVISWRFKGQFDHQAMNWALDHLIRAHDMFRIQLESRGEVGMMREGTAAPPPLEAVEDKDLDREMQRWVGAKTPPDHPSCSYRLFRTGPDTCALGLGGGHELLDAWTISNMTFKLAQCYNSILEGGALPKTPDPQYMHFAAWVNTSIKSEDLKPSRQYWESALQNTVPVFAAPLDRDISRHPMAAASAALPLSPDLRDGFEDLVRGQECTRFEGYFTLFNMVLSQLSGKEDILTAFAASVRRQPELRAIPGCLLNRVYVPLQVRAGDDFRTLLRRVHSKLQEAKKHLLWPAWQDVDPQGNGYPGAFFHYAREGELGRPEFKGLECTSSRFYFFDYSPLPLVLQVTEDSKRPMLFGLGQAGFCAESGLEDILHRYARLMKEIVA